MMIVKRVVLCFVFDLTFIAMAASALQMKFAKINDWGDSIDAEGMWRVERPTKETEVIPSDTRIECYKRGGMSLVGSAAYCLQATASVSGGVPSVDVEYFPVLQWSKDKIIAAQSATSALPICVWTQITVDLQSKIITSTDTRKLGKNHEGLDGSCLKLPMSQTYFLLDKTEEVVRRRLLQP
jgi:hypothetical protein